MISKRIHTLTQGEYFWAQLSKHSKISLLDDLVYKRKLVDRRSKGKLCIVWQKSVSKFRVLRKLKLDICNAGYDDGLPTSTLREITISQKINSNYVSQVLQTEIRGTNVYLISRYHTQNLKEFLEEAKINNTNTFELKKQLIEQVTYGLHQLHSKQILHRNLKPENVFVDIEDGDEFTISNIKAVMIGDLMFSREVDFPKREYTPEDPKERDRSGREARRMWQKSPEQILRKSKQCQEVDIWAYGCLAQEIIAGETLFTGECEIDQIFKIQRLLGTPTLNQNRDIINMQFYSCNFPNWKIIDIRDIYRNFEIINNDLKSVNLCNKLLKVQKIAGSSFIDLLHDALQLDVTQRINSEDILKSEFLGIPFPVPIVPEHVKALNLFRECEITQRNLFSNNQLNRNRNITPSMRKILVDWIVEVHFNLKHLDSTLNMSVYLLDYVSHILPNVNKHNQQLIGTVCSKIIDVLNENSREQYKQNNSVEYSALTNRSSTPMQIVNMEKTVLQRCGCIINLVTPQHFINLFSFVLNTPHHVLLNSRMINEIFMQHEFQLRQHPSLIAYTTLVAGYMMSILDTDADVINNLRMLVGDWHAKKTFSACYHDMRIAWTEQKTGTVNAVFAKQEQQGKDTKLCEIRPLSFNFTISNLFR